jgi:hypothetical protein
MFTSNWLAIYFNIAYFLSINGNITFCLFTHWQKKNFFIIIHSKTYMV